MPYGKENSIMKLLHRLKPYIIGDRLHTKKEVVKQAESRLKEKKLILKTHDYVRKETHTIKSYRNMANPGPNAPLLKRMVQNPQTLEKGFFSRLSLQRPKLVDRPKPTSSTEVQNILRRDKQIKKMRPMELHHKIQARTIPSLEEWLAGKRRE